MSFQSSLSTETVMAAYPEVPLIVAPDAPVGEVLQIMRQRKSNCILICYQGQLLGIFTDRNALRWMARQATSEISLQDQPISRWMTGNPVSLRASTCVGKAIRMMSAGRYRHLPVVNPLGTTIGLTSVQGILRYLVEHFPDTVYTLPPPPGKKPQ